MRYKRLKYDIKTGVQKIKTRTSLAISALTLGAAGLGMAVAIPLVAHADSQSINFENPPYTLGSISGQDGWNNTVNPSIDQAIVPNTYGYTSFGAQSLRISNAFTDGAFGDWLFAKPLTNAVGEVDSTDGGFSRGTLQPHFEEQFDIASTVPGAQQPGLQISVSADRGDGSRMAYLRFQDGTNGIDVFFDDVTSLGTAGTDTFHEYQIGTGLNRAVPHHIKLTLDAINGHSNDVVKVWIDGVLVKTGTSWEDYYRYDSEASAEQSPRIVKTVIIQARSGSGTAAGTQGHGFLIDNLTLLSGPIPSNLPTDKDQCKGDSWKTFGVFKNQGDCVSFVATGSKNLPSVH